MHRLHGGSNRGRERGWENRKGPWYGPDIPGELLADVAGEAAIGDFCAGDFSEGEPAATPVHIKRLLQPSKKQVREMRA